MKCFYRFDLHYQNPFVSQQDVPLVSSDESSTSIHNSQAYIATPKTLTDTTWYLNSGATRHITSDGNSMTAKSDYSRNGKVSIGDGSQLSISHIGHLVVTAPKPLKLKNILLVPSITKNLISISKFALENDVIVEFNANCCYVKDNQSKEVLLQGTLKNGLYQLNLLGASQASSSVYDNNLCRLDLQLQQPSLPDSNNLSSYAFLNNAENVPDSACNT